MSSKIETDFGAIHGIGNSSNHNTIPIQSIPKSQKTPKWWKATIDSIERKGIDQLHENIRFNSYRRMTEGRFTYQATDLNSDMEMPWFDKEIRQLRQDRGIPTYIKHFDFIGIVVNALSGIYSELDDRYRIESIDEYSTNEYIRQKTEMLHTYAQQVFIEEVNRMLMLRGLDPNKQDFSSEEEQQQYQQQIQEQTKALTPSEIESFMSKNFKVVATEWAQNTLNSDKKRFYLNDMDREQFVDFLLTGRWFRHYRVGYDSYYIERWLPEETFFSQDVHARFPQDGEYAGRITTMSPSDILGRFGHLMTLKEQESIGNYWNQSKNWDSANGSRVDLSTSDYKKSIFPKPTQTPFHNYFDHLANLEIENALGTPLGTTIDANGNASDTWLPRQEEEIDNYSNLYSTHLRDDINVRKDTVRVTELYWRSAKRLSVLIYENDLGSISLELVTDDLLSDFIEDNDIKKLKNISLQELKLALKEDRLNEYKNTICFTYVPEIWKGIKIKGNGSTLKKDLYLDVKPLDYQVKGENSAIYDVKLPITGMIDSGITVKLAPYQQLHNICMNQITELLEKELGVFFTFDITGLGEEYQDETTEDAIYRIRENIKDTGLMGFDLSRQNTQGNQVNLFQRQEVVYATQVQYRWQLAQQYKQEALSQIGITPQTLGQTGAYETAAGIKEGAQAKYSLINHLFDKMNTAKAKGMEVHLAIAQYCEVEGTDATLLTRKGDGELAFLDILKEDGELFSLRSLSVMPVTDSGQRKKVEEIKQVVLSDNTIQRNMGDVIELLTNPVLVEIQQKAKEMEAKSQKAIQEDRQFQDSQLQKQLEANAADKKEDRDHELKVEYIRAEARIEEQQINAYSRASLSKDPESNMDRIDRATKIALDDEYAQKGLLLKEKDLDRKIDVDKNSKKMELMKLAQKSEELRLKNKALDVQREGNIINKN
jgi:hypothetical protein